MDIRSRVQLEQALCQFNESVLAVVHNGYDFERFAEQICGVYPTWD